MNRNFLVGVAMIGVTGLLVIAGSARAEDNEGPPPKGWMGSFANPYIICDSKEQIKEIADAGRDDGMKLVAKFKEFNTTLDSKNNPTCVYAPPQRIVAGESEDMGDATAQSGIKVHSWSLHIGNAAGEGFMLY